MRQVSAALRAAIDAGERIIDSTFTVDWDNDGVQDIDDLSRKVDRIQVTQSLESSLPQQVQVVPGVAVAELNATIARGNTVRYDVPVIYRSLTTSSVITGTTLTWSVAKPTTAKVDDVILISVFVSMANIGSTLSGWHVLSRSNVSLIPMSVRGDGTSGNTRIEGLLLYRRVTVNDPDTYFITLPGGSTVMYASAAVNIGDQNIMGITDFTQKGEDLTDAPTSILLPQLKVDVPGSTILSFFGAASYSVSGLGFSPIDVNDVEQTEFTVSGGAASKPSLRVSVNTHSNAAQGLYQKGVTITGTPTTNVATVAFGVVLAPKLAGDEAQHAAWTFSELNPNSPIAGKTRIRRKTQWALRIITDNGFETIPLFTGFTTAPSATSRVATIKALDNRETMRNTGQGLNLVGAFPTSQDLYSGQSLPTMPGLESTWMISRLFFTAFMRTRPQTSGIFTYDAQPPNISGLGYFPSPLGSRYAMVWAPMHGSALPIDSTSIIQYAYTETLNHALRSRVRFEVGPYVAATKNEAVGVSTYMAWSSGSWRIWSTTTRQIAGRVSCWIRRNQTTSSLVVNFPDNNGNIYQAWVEVTSGGVVRLRVEGSGVSRTVTGPTIANDSVWHFLGVHFDSLTTVVTFRVDSVNTTGTLTAWSNAAITINGATANVTLSDGMQLAELNIAGGYNFAGSQTGIPSTDTWPNENFTPTAFVDKSENILDAIPFINPNADAFSVASDIANAEFAAIYFDEDGYPHFRTSRSDASTVGQTIQRTVTARKSIKDIAYESGVLQIRNIITAAYTPFASSVNKEIFSASGVIAIAPGTAGSAPQQIAISVQGPVLTLFAPTYTAYSSPSGSSGGTDLTSQVTVSASNNDAGKVVISMTNSSGSIAYLVNSSGQPNLHVNATYLAPLTGVDSSLTYSDSDSIREFGEQPLSVQQSEWVQREESAASIALKLLSDLCQPHPVITNLPIKGDPSLQFGDLVTAVDQNGIGVNGRYRITGKDPVISPSDGFTQNLVVRSAPQIAYWNTNFWDDGYVWG